MSKHKVPPGPWKKTMFDDGILIHDADGNLVETVYAGEFIADLIVSIPDMREALRKAIQLASVAWDWNLEEVEIDGKMVNSHDLRSGFEAALKKAGKP